MDTYGRIAWREFIEFLKGQNKNNYIYIHTIYKQKVPFETSFNIFISRNNLVTIVSAVC